ncbi:hypothetical protein HY797_00255 [Candidatus Falkowbacteria bacterium]|nr:hypothetical protein [Candidatus Falkowbacteria bacterium]
MKKNFFKLSFIFAFVLFFAITGQAKADTETTTIRLQIKTNDASLYDREINVTACVDSLSASTTSVNALCALEQSGLAYGLGWYDDLAFLNSVGGYLNNDGENGIYWGWFENLNYSNLALNQYVLKSGDKILLAYNVNPLRISADNTSLFVGATSTITVEQFGLDASWSPVWLPAASSTLMIDGVEAENTSGVYKYKPLSAGEKIVYAKKDGYINSNNLAITAEELKVKTIRLQIKTHDVSLYDADIAVTACPDSDGSTTSTINVRCAIDQAGLTDPSDWAYGGTFLNSIKGLYASDYVNNIYWNWFSNLEYGQVAMTQHVLANGEKLLLTYNVNPLRISADNIAPYVNATSTITLEQFGLDASWNPAWYPAASSSLIIAGQEIENISGVYEYIATATAPVLIYGKKSGCIDSEEIIITAQEIAGNDNENNSSNNNQSSGGSVILPTATGGGATIVSLLKVDLGKAIDFLISKQAADGSFGSAIITDWAAIALSSINSNGLAAQKAKSYLLTDPNPLAGMNSVSDYSRRAMALMSLSISPYNGAKTNYIKKIIDLFDGQQFGDASLYNDDISLGAVLT